MTNSRWLNATVSRSACRYNRVAHLYPHSYEQDAKRPNNFHLIGVHHPEGDPPFSITSKEGILYVSHPESLRMIKENFVELKIGWDLLGHDSSTIRRNRSVHFRIELFDAVKNSTTSDDCASGSYCSKFRTETGCNQAVGSLATDQRGCAWRRYDINDSAISSGPTRMYQTCSPDLSTCPDGYPTGKQIQTSIN